MKIIKPAKKKQQDQSIEQHEHSFEDDRQAKPSVKKKSAVGKGSITHKFSKISEQASHNQSDLGKQATNNFISGSEIDIFDDDESWDKVEFTRTNTDLNRFKKKLAKTRVNQGDGLGDIRSADFKSKKTTSNATKSKLKKPKVEYQDNQPLVNGKKRRRSELENTQGPSAFEQLIDSDKKEFNSVLSRGMRLLAIREHSVLEISNKLIDKFADYEDVDASLVYAVVDELVKLDYVSDERFAESYVRSRGNKGFGPVKIKAELKGKGISNSFIQDYLKEGAGSWFDKAEQQYIKKYGDGPVTDYNTWTKRARFMQSRGFTMEHIHVTLPKVKFD